MKFLLEDKEGEGIMVSTMKNGNNLKTSCNSRNKVHKALPSPNIGHPAITSARTSNPQANPISEKWSEALIPRLKTRTRFLTSLKPARHPLPSEVSAEKPRTQDSKLKKNWTCEGGIKYDFKNMRWYDCRPRLIINRYYRKNFTLNCIQKPAGNFMLSSVTKNSPEKLYGRDQADMNLYRTTFNVRRVKPLAERLTETNPKQKAYIVEDWFNKGNIDPQLLYE